MQIKVRAYASVYIVDVAGEVDLYNAFKLKEVVARMMQKDVRNMVVNLENVTYIDSSGVGALISIYSTVKKVNGAIWIANVHGPVKRVIEFTKLIGYLPIVETIQEAITKMTRTA
jgi:anti-sigma B factor antagonist